MHGVRIFISRKQGEGERKCQKKGWKSERERVCVSKERMEECERERERECVCGYCMCTNRDHKSFQTLPRSRHLLHTMQDLR